MNAQFSIDVDVPRNLVSLVLGGFFGPDDITRLVAARDAAHRRLQCGPNQHLTLADISDMVIQSQESMATFQQVLADPRNISKRLAFIVNGGSLARMQSKRATDRPNVGFFETAEDAEQWLFAR